MSEATQTRTILREGQPITRRMDRYRVTITAPDAAARIQTIDRPRVRLGTSPGCEIALPDPTASRIHAELLADDVGLRLRDLGSKNGTFLDGTRVRDAYVRSGARIRLGRTEILVEPEAGPVEIPLASADRFGPLLGRSAAMREVFALLARAAPTPATVLVLGETGTGKELVARALHEASDRASGPYVVLDCSSVPATLMESELFGHERGAFSGADRQRVGRFEEAQGGTLFLDEIGELPIDLQPKLLRALEQREIRRLGGTAPIACDVRIVAATHRDLAREVTRGSFREDLYFRLAVVEVVLPPLRERIDDLALLVEHFARRIAAAEPAHADRFLASLDEAARRRLAHHPWHGNVRELRNVIERSLALGGEGVALPTKRSRAAGGDAEVDLDRPFLEQKEEVIAAFERAYVLRQLDLHAGNISRAATAAGIDRMYFKRLVKKHRA